jgi:capsular polysaccharide export protein
LRSFWRKAYYKVKERSIQHELTGPLSKRFFIVPLQVHNDAQVHNHSEFPSVVGFICSVVASFATHAPEDTVLVIKHHPMDRGYNDYTGLLRRLGRKFGIEGRLMYVHDLHLPSLLNHARGTVLINSTVGLSALFHNCPLKVCGDAIYAMKGLVYQGSLDTFWVGAADMKIDYELFRRFRSHVIETTQVNGSFYKRLRGSAMSAGIRWSEQRCKSRKDETDEDSVSSQDAYRARRGATRKALDDGRAGLGDEQDRYLRSK